MLWRMTAWAALGCALLAVTLLAFAFEGAGAMVARVISLGVVPLLVTCSWAASAVPGRLAVPRGRLRTALMLGAAAIALWTWSVETGAERDEAGPSARAELSAPLAALTQWAALLAWVSGATAVTLVAAPALRASGIPRGGRIAVMLALALTVPLMLAFSGWSIFGTLVLAALSLLLLKLAAGRATHGAPADPARG